VIGLLVMVGITLAIVYQTELGRSSWGYVVASRNEVRKVVWPSRQETVQTTLMVVVMVFVMALLLWIIDWFLAQGVQMLTGSGG
jgi:preprotein translocase subunit SecE